MPKCPKCERTLQQKVNNIQIMVKCFCERCRSYFWVYKDSVMGEGAPNVEIHSTGPHSL